MWFRNWKKWASTLKKNIYALYLVSKHKNVPLAARIIVGIVVAYALSPIDLIPDFIPVLGYLDDLILLPLGIWLALKFIPDPIWLECQREAALKIQTLPQNKRAAFAIICIWVIALLWLVLWLVYLFL